MLSRVAAVKAPRTHNRLRVTGSRGKGKEGRESERQMLTMSRRVFVFAVVIFPAMMMFCGGGAAHAAKEHAEDDCAFTIEEILDAVLRKDGPAEENDSPETPISEVLPSEEVSPLPVTAINSLSVVGMNVMVAVTAQVDHEDGSSTVLTRLIVPTEEGAEWALAGSSTANRQTEYAKCTERSKDVTSFFNPTVFSKNNNLYLLLYPGKKLLSPERGVPKSEYPYPWLIIGEVKSMDASDEKKNLRIIWGNSSPLSAEVIAPSQKKSLQYFSASGGVGFLTHDGSVLVPINGWTEEKEEFSLILYSGDRDKAWKFSKGLPKRYFAPVIVEWVKGRLFMITSCNDGYRKVYESNDNGESWTEAVGTLSGVWGNSRNRTGKGVQSGFVSATIEGKKVLLVSLPVYSTENGRGRLNLWLSDGRRIVDIGAISTTDEDITESALLYRNIWGEELISVYGSRDANGTLRIFSMRLTGHLGLIKSVVKRWKEMDMRVVQLYRVSIAEDSLSSVGACSTRMLTNGLVGFLSNGFDRTQWKDEYVGPCATVHGVAATNSGGAIFKGVGAGAEWPVGKQGQNQLYYFANTQFTLLATVSIHEVPERGITSIPLMGVKVNNPNGAVTTLLGISYRADKTWEVTFNGMKTTAEASEWELGKEYQVALLLEDGDIIFVYLNGQLLGSSKTMPNGKERLLDISHFYFGGEKDEKTGNRHVKVWNVLLYNRVLSASELECRLPEEVVQKLRSGLPTSPKKYDLPPKDDDFYAILLREKVSVLYSNATGYAGKTASDAATVLGTGVPNKKINKNGESCMYTNIHGGLLLVLLWIRVFTAFF
ncbi:neutral sphingomyelinase activation associated factor-like protein [Trypanosoma cruzi marinkellei]|uniref:Neutral sphingomyelinase activation associated factor-like protein n=1 Tax=Trypanosoma cruzi marinkellei TaxID=85056 RepID=K2MI64_TRYCR|nr:neutral sphingomyelinase activation associated factor-like protein [Trypanosoma cruzi marinkellei]